MIHTQSLLKVTAAILLSIATLPEARAQATITAAVPTTTSPYKTCATENNITLPAKGSGQKLTSEQRETMHACIKAARKAAFVGCAETAGFTPTEGQKPTEEQHQAIHQCMKSQGFHGHRHNREQGMQKSASI